MGEVQVREAVVWFPVFASMLLRATSHLEVDHERVMAHDSRVHHFVGSTDDEVDSEPVDARLRVDRAARGTVAHLSTASGA